MASECRLSGRAMGLRHAALLVAGGVASGLAYFFSTGLGDCWPLAWIAPFPLLAVAFRCRARTAALTAFLAYILGSLNLLSYLRMLMPAAAVAATLLVPAIAFTLAVLVARLAVRRLAPWLAGFAFPAAWTTYEWLLSVVSPHGTAGSLAYSQTELLPLLQVVSLTGLWGVTFILTLVPSGLAVAWQLRARWREAILGLAVCFSVGLLALGYGWLRLLRPAPGPAIRVGLVAADSMVRYFNADQPQESLPVAQAYARRIQELADQGARVVVLPEKLVGVTPAFAGDVLRVFRDAARAGGVTVVAGLNQIGTARSRNTAFVFSPEGQVRAEYDKARLVPGYESDYRAGTAPGLFRFVGAQWGVAICKDMDFPEWTRAYSKAGTGVMLAPAWDFVRDARLHARMAIVRGVEGGFAVVRAAQQGLLTVSDHHGRILAEASSSRAPEVVLLAAVPAGPGRTLYSAFGDWFAWCAALLLLLILLSSLSSRRPPPPA